MWGECVGSQWERTSYSAQACGVSQTSRGIKIEVEMRLRTSLRVYALKIRIHQEIVMAGLDVDQSVVF